MRLFFVSIILTFVSFPVLAQVKTVDQQLLWLGLGIDADINSNLSVGIFSEERRFIFPMQRQQRVWLDVHANYESNQKWSNKAGLWLFEISDPQNPFDPYLGEVKETRPYHAVTYTLARDNGYHWKFSIMSEYRIFRPLESTSFFTGNTLREDLRERLKVTYSIPLGLSTHLNLANELHLTLLSSGEQPLFNQNRLQATVKQNFGKGISASLGYIYWFQPTGNSEEYFGRHITSLRLNYRFKM